jgi:hypothetical protein
MTPLRARGGWSSPNGAPGPRPEQVRARQRLFGTARTLANRAVANYAGKDRIAEYAALLGTARDAGYELTSLADFHERAAREAQPEPRWLVLRHDVDIDDTAGNTAFWEAERAVGARSTFYFRLSKAEAHRPLIRNLLRDGFEVGYHYEEGATTAKRRHLTSRADVFRHAGEIEQSFRDNCAMFRRRWNPDLVSVASHGDWINRRLAFANHELLTRELIVACGLQFEAYGSEIMSSVDVYVSDVARRPQRWANGYGLGDALRDVRTPVYLLTHERNWHTARRANVRADIGRLAEALRYRLGPLR